jgi:hypothetical protein
VTAYRVEYKLEIYAPRAEQSDPVTEPDLLTPIAGAPHSEPARYSTIPLAGHQPYIVRIPGRKSRFDPVTKSTDVGQFTVQLLDRKLATSDQVRHLTATMGDVYGRNRWPGCKLRIWESIDGGTTWIPYFTGRIQETSLDGPCVIEAVVRSMLAELSIPVMVGRPSTALTFVSPSQYCPLGVAAPYGPLPATPGIPLTFTTTGALFSFNGNVAAATPAHTMTDALRAVVPTVPYVGQATLTDLASAEPLEIRLRCQFTSGTFAGTTKEYRVRGAYFYPAGGRFTVRTAGSNDVLYGVAIATLANVLDPFYAALPGNGDTANVSVIAADTPPTPATPIRIGDVHPVALLRYLCRGDFSYLNPDGTARPRVQIATASFTALEADPTFGVFRGPVEAQSKLKAWAERYLTQVFGFGFRDNALGEIEVFDARTPTTLAGIPTITDADRYDDTPLGWRHVSGITAIKTTVYLERKFSIDASVDVASLKTPNDLISSTPDPIVLRTAFRADQTEQVLEIDAIGLRWFESERLQERSRRDIMQGQRRRLADELRGLYGSGASTVNGDFHRHRHRPRAGQHSDRPVQPAAGSGHESARRAAPLPRRRCLAARPADRAGAARPRAGVGHGGADGGRARRRRGSVLAGHGAADPQRERRPGGDRSGCDDNERGGADQRARRGVAGRPARHHLRHRHRLEPAVGPPGLGAAALAAHGRHTGPAAERLRLAGNAVSGHDRADGTIEPHGEQRHIEERRAHVDQWVVGRSAGGHPGHSRRVRSGRSAGRPVRHHHPQAGLDHRDDRGRPPGRRHLRLGPPHRSRGRGERLVERAHVDASRRAAGGHGSLVDSGDLGWRSQKTRRAAPPARAESDSG